jgi:hypothetical protein
VSADTEGLPVAVGSVLDDDEEGADSAVLLVAHQHLRLPVLLLAVMLERERPSCGRYATAVKASVVPRSNIMPYRHGRDAQPMAKRKTMVVLLVF